MIQDFTLVIPTYNRPKQLQALLTYLAAQQPRCRILILDSSQPEQRHANRRIAELTNFKLEYVEFPSETHPFDKFREGLHKVTTEFCALCADDDLVLLDCVQLCLEALRRMRCIHRKSPPDGACKSLPPLRPRPRSPRMRSRHNSRIGSKSGMLP